MLLVSDHPLPLFSKMTVSFAVFSSTVACLSSRLLSPPTISRIFSLFASTVADGVKETDDFSIPERLFTVSEVEVETSDINSPDDLLGLVSLNNRGRTVIGYIKQIKSYIGKAKSSSYTLIVKDIKK